MLPGGRLVVLTQGHALVLLHLRSVVPAFLAVTAAVVAADATTGPFWVSESGAKACAARLKDAWVLPWTSGCH